MQKTSFRAGDMEFSKSEEPSSSLMQSQNVGADEETVEPAQPLSCDIVRSSLSNLGRVASGLRFGLIDLDISVRNAITVVIALSESFT